MAISYPLSSSSSDKVALYVENMLATWLEAGHDLPSSPQATHHHIMEMLTGYVALIQKWQDAYNLVAPSTLAHIWERHICDSLQLMPLIINKMPHLISAEKQKQQATYHHIDLGSGGGLPAIVIAIMMKALSSSAGEIKLTVNMVESTQKKAQFLQNCRRELGLEAKIYHNRIENLAAIVKPQKQLYHLITARALSDLNSLLYYAHPLCHKETILIFPKGKNAHTEIETARKNWHFTLEQHSSITDENAQILILSSLEPIIL